MNLSCLLLTGLAGVGVLGLLFYFVTAKKAV